MAFTIGSVVSVASGVTTTTTTPGVSIASVLPGRAVGVKIVQVGTATTAAKFKVQESYDGGTEYYDVTGEISAGTAAGTYTWGSIRVSDSATHVRIDNTAQSGGTSSTTSSQAGNITSY